MKQFKTLIITGIILMFLSSCIGDKKTVVGQELGDTNFVNTNFSGNKINFSDLPKNLCTYLSEGEIKNQYPSASKVLFDDGKTYQTKSCRFLAYFGEGEYNYLNGTLFATEDVLAEGEDWKETWELQKKMSKTAEYVSGIGQAAIWFGKKRELRIKLDGYTFSITVPGSSTKEEEVAKNRDYKNIAISLAKSTNLF